MAESETYSFETVLMHHEPSNSFYFTVPEEVGKAMSDKHSLRVICSAKGVEFPRALLRNRAGAYRLTGSKALKRKLKLEIGESFEMVMRKDSSKYGMPMPEELDVLLEQDEMGKKAFEALTPGKRRNIIYYVSSAKTEQTRIDRSIYMLERAKMGTL